MGSDDEPLIGVGVSRFFDVCFTASPKRFTLVWASTALSALIVICIIKPAMSRTLRRPGCMQRVYYRRIMLLPVVFSLSSFVVTINPTMQMITYALQKMYEAWVLSTFGLLFFMFLATESVSLKHGTLPTQRSQGRNLESILATLNVEGPKKHFAAPPCGCFALPFAAHAMDLRHVGVLVVMLRQYVIIAPSLACINLMVACSFSAKFYMSLQTYVLVVSKASAVVCIWALFVMYRSSHDILLKYNMTSKFIAIKAFLVLFIIQDNIIEGVVVRAIEHSGRGSCFEEAGFRSADWAVIQGRYIGYWLIALETIVMAIAVKNAFPASEISGVEGIDFHHDLLELEVMSSIGANLATSKDVSEEEEDSCADEASTSDG